MGYTYFSHRFGMRAKGKGWRLDYYLVILLSSHMNNLMRHRTLHPAVAPHCAMPKGRTAWLALLKLQFERTQGCLLLQGQYCCVTVLTRGVATCRMRQYHASGVLSCRCQTIC